MTDTDTDTDTDTSLLNPTRRPQPTNLRGFFLTKGGVVRVSTFRVRSQGEMVGAP